VGTSVSGADLVPGVYERQGGSFLGVAIDRVYAPGGALALFGLLWAVAALAVRRGSRQGLWPIAAVCLVAVLFTLSRTLYMAAGCGVLVAILTAVTFRRGRARRMVVAFAVLFAIGGIALGPRLSQGVGEVRGGGGNLGTRIQGFNQRQAQIRDNALTGVGFSASSEGERRNAFSDSSAITFLVRFGLLGAALLAAVFVDTWRRAGRLARGGGDAGREVAALARGMIATVVVAAWTTEILTSPGAVPLLAAAVAAVHMAGASHGADRSAVGGSVPTETGDAVPG
jgi:O-antigen ligase